MEGSKAGAQGGRARREEGAAHTWWWQRVKTAAMDDNLPTGREREDVLGRALG